MASSRVKKVCSVGAVIVAALGLYGYNEYGEKVGEASPDAVYSKAGNPLRISKDGLELIGNAEGCRQDPYKCPADIWTVGLGSTTGVNPAKEYSIKEISVMFVKDTMNAQDCLEQNVEAKLKRRLPQGVFDAMASFVFNHGCTKFRSYTIYKDLLKGDYVQACNRLTIYNKGGGKILPGLVKRRGDEKKVCLKGL